MGCGEVVIGGGVVGEVCERLDAMRCVRACACAAARFCSALEISALARTAAQRCSDRSSSILASCRTTLSDALINAMRVSERAPRRGRDAQGGSSGQSRTRPAGQAASRRRMEHCDHLHLMRPLPLDGVLCVHHCDPAVWRCESAAGFAVSARMHNRASPLECAIDRAVSARGVPRALPFAARVLAFLRRSPLHVPLPRRAEPSDQQTNRQPSRSSRRSKQTRSSRLSEHPPCSLSGSLCSQLLTRKRCPLRS